MTARLDDEVVIARLRLRGVRGDPVSARLRAARILDAASFRPPGLPPSAILVIRELRDPLPGMFPGSGSTIQPPPTWNRALASRIEMIARYARRPALEAVADNTAAVLFLDAGEMIACFARDWLRGTVFRRWWWERWKPNAATETALLDLWLTYPIDIPAVLDHLARSGDVVEFARRLSPAGIERVVGRVLETFALRELHVALSNSGGSTPGENPPGAADETSAPPWERIAPDSTHSSLPPAAQVLIGVGLTLARAPLLARRSDYAESAQRWVRQKTAVPFAPAAPTAQQDSAQPIPTGAVESIPPAPDDDARAARTDARSERDTTAERRAEAQANDAHTGDFTSSTAERVGRRLPQEQTEASRENAALDSAEPLDGEAITTEYGGVFYLIDLALYLELYADITSPADSNIELPLWDFLALVGERLIGQELCDDPV